MTETINYVREDQFQDERTAGMIRAVNDNHNRMSEAERQAFRKNQARIQALELEARAEEQAQQAEEIAKQARFWTLVHTVVGAAAILAVIYYLREIGAMHDALAQSFALVTAFGAGKNIGEVMKEGTK